MYFPTASNETFQDVLESAMTGRADLGSDPSEDEGFDHAGTWGPVGGVGGFVLLLASAVAVAHKYWGAFETLSHSLTNLLDAAPLRFPWRISLTMIGLGRTLEGLLIVLGTII